MKASGWIPAVPAFQGLLVLVAESGRFFRRRERRRSVGPCGLDMRALSQRLIYAFVVTCATASPAFANAKEETLFGSTEASSGALIGILYDLKQSQARKPLKIDYEIYAKIVNEFVSSQWDEQVLNRYFRAPRPLYATQVFVPMISASIAPDAFGVGEEIGRASCRDRVLVVV